MLLVTAGVSQVWRYTNPNCKSFQATRPTRNLEVVVIQRDHKRQVNLQIFGANFFRRYMLANLKAQLFRNVLGKANCCVLRKVERQG